MMLWYKAWRESRTVFVISAAVLVAMCIGIVLFEPMFRSLFEPRGATFQTYTQYVYRVIYSGAARGLFTVFVLVLGLGGLQKERAQRSACFTLSLPVSRLRLVSVRAALGLAEVAILSALPVMLIPALSSLLNESYPVTQALQFGVLWFCCGAVIFAAAFLASTVFTGGYTALTTTFVVYFFSTGAASLPLLRRYPLHINHITNGYGMPYFDPRTAMLVGPLPWTILIAMGFLSFAFIGLGARITLGKDFP